MMYLEAVVRYKTRYLQFFIEGLRKWMSKELIFLLLQNPL